jgi:hypothetical protein
MNPAELKRQILMDSDRTGIRKRVTTQPQDSGITQNDVLEIGEALEQMTNTKGWMYAEAYILKQADPMGFLFGEDDPIRKGKARGLVEFMQYIDQMIKARNEIIARTNAEREARGTSETNTDES